MPASDPSSAPPEFRGAFFARDYDASVSFYRDGLGLIEIESWDRGPDDRGTMFRAAGGIIEVLARPPVVDAPWDARTPQGVMFVVEVDDVDDIHARAVAAGAVIREGPRHYPWGHHALSVADPDGILLYLFSPAGATS